jgi:hypothetical protein
LRRNGYPTDDQIHDELLAYYGQREWRIAAGLVVDGIPHSRLLSNDERTLVFDIDTDFWTKEISDDKTTFRRIDDAYVIGNFEGAPISELISAVIVPPEAFDEAKSIFGDRVIPL